jgi:hypothetical protein
MKMKNLLITMCLLTSFCLSGWAQTDYLQFEVGYMKPKTGSIALLKKGIAAHAAKFHAADPYKMFIYEVVTGPRSGQYFVGLGPATFTQLDSRPSSAEHEADWQNNVVAYLDSEGETSYWRMDKDLDYEPEGITDFSKSRLRWVTLNPGEGDRWSEQMKKVYDVFKAKKYGAQWHVYRRFGASAGPHVCTEMAFGKWAYLDTDVNFMKDFNEVNGEGSYDRFMDELAIAVDRTKTYDEMISFLPELSSPSTPPPPPAPVKK